MTRQSTCVSLTLTTLAALGLAAPSAYAGTTITDTVKYSSYVQNKVNSAGSGYVATSTPKKGSPGSGTVFYTNDSNVDTEGPTSLAAPSQYAAYSLLDFATPYTFNAPVASVNNVSLTITEYPASFGNANPVDVYLVTDNRTSDYYSANSLNNSTLKYDTSMAGQTNPLGLGAQLGTAYALATLVPYSNSQNQIDTINLSLSPAASTLLTSQLNSGSDIRLVISQDSSALSGAAEYDGSYYANKAGSTSPLSLNFSAFDAQGNADGGSPAPEPSAAATLALVEIGLAGMLLRARRRSNKAPMDAPSAA